MTRFPRLIAALAVPALLVVAGCTQQLNPDDRALLEQVRLTANDAKAEASKAASSAQMAATAAQAAEARASAAADAAAKSAADAMAANEKTERMFARAQRK
ncbi:MAG TPA: alanine-zipper protein [Ferrovibrio sp.]|uniref:alanine-zipper protein n=1 Tax=Ferrovibrio sp. TaxID=1917215 RepID=UPI002ED0FB04